MRVRRHLGVTLPEILVSLTIISVVFVTISVIFMQSTKIYMRKSGHTIPQEAQMLALKRMQRFMRQAMFVNIVTPTPSTWVELCLPRLNSSGMNVLVRGENGQLGLQRDPNKDLCFFLGVREYPDPANTNVWNAIPNNTGHTIFRALSSTRTADGKYPNAEVMIDGVLSVPMVPDLSRPGQMKPGRIFEYWPTDPNDPTRPTRDTQLVVVSLTIPVTVLGNRTEYHTLQTQFCLRNWNSSKTIASQ